MARWMCNYRPMDKLSAEILRTRVKMNSMRESLQNGKLNWFGHLERIEVSTWSVKCRILTASDSFPRGRPRENQEGPS